MEELYLFSAGSANDDLYKKLWIKGASLFIPQINKLIDYTDYNFKIVDIQNFINNKSKILEYIFLKNGSDKSTQHNYHILYSYILEKLGKNINILEIGLGTNNPNLISTMGENGIPGASLYSFREYLPEANIYGADIDKNILFECERIKTCYVDQLELNTFENISDNFGNIKFDLVIDDGLHSIGANLNTLLYAIENLNTNGWIVIEDIHIKDNWKSIDFILNYTNKFKTYFIKDNDKYLYVVNKL
jgi:hypothetical protein